jgi:hypothetical protein
MSLGDTLRAVIRSGFIQIRIANVRAPRIVALWTPLIADNFG